MSSCSSRLIAAVAVFSSLAVLSAPLLAQETGEDRPVKSLGGAVHADPFTGVATTSIPIEVPPGRSGMQPSLALTYNSAAGNGWLGMGWDLEQEGIYRQTKWGVNYGTNTGDKAFVVKMAGVSGELVPTPAPAPSTQWSAKIEGGFSKIEKLTAGDGQSMWKVTTKQGRKHYFGQTPTSRRVDPANAANIFGWLLDRVEDIDGNYMTYSYSTDTANNQVYLDHIDYAGNGATTPTNTIKFWLDDGLRPDQGDMYSTNYRIKTKYRLKAVEVKVNGLLVRVYEVTYNTSLSTSRSVLASVKQYGKDAIVGSSGVITSGASLSPVTFAYSTDTANFTDGATWTTGWCNGGTVTPGIDVNGDGKQDLVCYAPSGVTPITSNGSGAFSSPGECGSCGKPYWGDFNADGRIDAAYMALIFVEMLPWGPVYDVSWNVALASTAGTISPGGAWLSLGSVPQSAINAWVPIVGDFNGDGKSDLGLQSGSTVSIYLSNGAGSFSSSAGFSGCVNSLGDFNGDGQTDLLCRDGAGSISVATSSGGAFSGMATWVSSWCASGQFGSGDFNGDGKLDVYCHPTDGTTKVALSTGASFVNGGNWITDYCTSGQFGTGDFNGDGKRDLYCHPADGSTQIALSTGAAFVENDAPWFSSWCTSGSYGVSDFNGDGKSDLYCFNSGTVSVARSGGNLGKPELLTFVSSGLGGAVLIGYSPSTQWLNTQLPFSVQRVSTMTTCDNWDGGTSICIGTSSTISHSYSGGYYHIPERELRGVNKTTVTNQAGANGEQTISEIWFHQGNDLVIDANDPSGAAGSTRGKPYRSKVMRIGNPNVPVSETTTTYLADGDGVAPYFTPPALTTAKHYDKAGAEAKQTQSEAVSYDAYGNLTLSYNLGDLSTGSDDTTTAITYAPADTTNWLIGFPTAQRIYKGLSPTPVATDKLSETLTYYDGASSCTTPAGSATTVTKGHVTKVERWLNGGTNPISGMEYNAFGGVTCTRDPKGNTATLAYDPTITFPLTSTNALGHVTTTSYYGVNGVASDTGLYGQLKSITDPNSRTSANTYDALGRRLTTATPDGLVQTMAYNYGGAFVVGTQHVQSTTSGGGLSANLVSKTYFDGLGRTTKTESPGAADGGGALKVLVTETQYQYDVRGLTKQVSLPYIQGSESVTGRWRTMAYDALGRLIKTTNPDNTSSQVCYNVWTTMSINPKLHKKVETKDALGRLVTVQEYTGTGSVTDCSGGTLYATTSYSYDLLGNLLGVTDAKGNVSSMTYDTLGRKLTMHDPDMGDWSYTYDANGNLLTQVDAKNQKLCFSYDALNRRTQKNYGTTTVACGTNTVVYAYDDTVAANNGKGRLKQVTDPAQTVTFQYDSRGRIKQSAKTLDGTTYTTTSAYDGLGRLTTVNYPTSPIKTVTYTYDGPQLKSVQEGATTYVTYAGWNALGQPATSTFGNGVVATNTYANSTNTTCIQQSFRLCTLKTTGPGTGGGGNGTLTFTPEADTSLQSDAPDTAFGALNHVVIDSSPMREAYLRFNITGLPTGATITSASLTLVNGGYATPESNDGGALYKFAPADPMWAENGSTWNTRAGLVGADASGVLATVGAVTSGASYTFANLQSALSGNGRVTFVLRPQSTDGAGYFTKEAALTSQRPVLTVTYTTGGTAGATHQDLRYTYEANGNVGDIYDATVAANAGDQHFAYDELDRLTLANGPYGASGANASLTYAYDEIGNLTNNSQVGAYGYPTSGPSSVRPHAVSSTGSGSGSTVTFTPEADTYLDGSLPDTVSGSFDFVMTDSDPVRETYLRFNLSGLPAGATITSASLTLVNGGYAASGSDNGGTIYKYAPADAAWAEGVPTWNNRAGLVGSDASGPLATVGAVSSGQSATFTNLHSAITGNGRVTFVIRSSSSDSAGYFAKEWGTAGQRPVLSVTYTTAGANTYSYDANGNMTGGSGRTYTWNPENKPLTTVQGGTTTTFVYDGDGGRAKKIVGTTTTRYISKLYECDNTNCSRFIWAGSTRIATIAVNTGAIQYWHGDHLGSSSVITDSTGAKVQTVTYYPFGGTRTNQSPSTSAIDVPYKYTSQELDGSMGLYNYNARMYDPVLGRFITADTIVPEPVNPQDLNRYSYVRNNPLKYTDPTGYCATEDNPQSCGGGYFNVELFPERVPGAEATCQCDINGDGAIGSAPFVPQNIIPSVNTILTETVQMTVGLNASQYYGAELNAAYQNIERLALVRGLADQMAQLDMGIIGLGLGAQGLLRVGWEAITGGFQALESLLGFSTSGGESVSLFRAVTSAELADINSLGRFRVPSGGNEGKFFATSAEGAASYAKQAYEAGGLFREGPYTIVGTQLERALVTDMMRAPWGVDRGIQTIVVPSEMLPRLAPPTVLPYTPIPKVH